MNFAILTESKYFETTLLNVLQIRKYHFDSNIYIGDIGLDRGQMVRLKYYGCIIVDLTRYSEKQEWFKMIMKPVFVSQLDLPVYFMDADTVLMNEMDLIPEKDIVVTVRESKYGRINSGVFIVSNRHLLLKWTEKAKENYNRTKDRLSEQNALNQIAYNYNAKEVPCDKYNYPKVENGIPDDVVVVHLKSGRYKDKSLVQKVRDKCQNTM